MSSSFTFNVLSSLRQHFAWLILHGDNVLDDSDRRMGGSKPAIMRRWGNDFCEGYHIN